MFGSTQKVKLTLDADGMATAVASSTTEGIFAGAISHLLTHLTEDEVVIGAGRSVGAVGIVYAASAFTNYRLTGKFNINPYVL